MSTSKRLNALRDAANHFAQEVRAEFGDRVDSIVLYGSVARGDIHEDSDVDVLVIGQDLAAHRKRVDKIVDAQRKMFEDDFIWLQPITYDRDRFLKLYRIHAPYAENVVEDGVPLYDTGIFAADGIRAIQQDSPSETVQAMLSKARTTLDSARLLMDNQGYDGAASFLCRAAQNAAQAALVQLGVRPYAKSGRLAMQFETQIVSPALIEARFSGLLRAVHQLRVKGDYNYQEDVTEPEAAAMANDVEQFIAAIRTMVAAPNSQLLTKSASSANADNPPSHIPPTGSGCCRTPARCSPASPDQ